MRGDRQHRRHATVAIKQAIDQVKIAGTATAGASGQSASQLSLGAGGKCAGLFMPHVNKLGLALAAYRVGNGVETISNNAVNAFDTSFCDAGYQFVSNSVCHTSILSN